MEPSIQTDFTSNATEEVLWITIKIMLIKCTLLMLIFCYNFFCELHTQILANTNPDYLLGENSGDDSSVVLHSLTKTITNKLIS